MRRESKNTGSVMVMALLFTTILIIGGGITFAVIQNRYRLVHQTASWQEALLAAEAGVDIAVSEMRKEMYDPDNAWKGWGSDPNAEIANTLELPDNAKYYSSTVLMKEGEGGQRSYSKIGIDEIYEQRNGANYGDKWYRVRSLGVAEVPGGAVAAGEKTDIRLRKFDLKKDRRTQQSLDQPQATRLIEAIVKPVGTFRLALFGVKTINMNNHNIVVDSYDSRDSTKSTNGFYDPAKRQENGDIATDGEVIEAGNAHIYGDASTNSGSVLDASNVTGEIRSDFYQDVFAVQPPNVTPDLNTPSSIKNGVDLPAKAGSPSQYKLDSIKMAGSDVLHITGAADGSPTYAQIVVTGDISMSGKAQIVLDPGVYVRLFVAGDADMTGNGVLNPNNPLNFQVYGLDRDKNADGSPKTPGEMKIAGNGGFRGTVYAPGYNIDMVGGGNEDSIYGAFVGWDVRMTGVQSVHYDEALGDGGLIADYKVVSWFEDVR